MNFLVELSNLHTSCNCRHRMAYRHLLHQRRQTDALWYVIELALRFYISITLISYKFYLSYCPLWVIGSVLFMNGSTEVFWCCGAAEILQKCSPAVYVVLATFETITCYFAGRCKLLLMFTFPICELIALSLDNSHILVWIEKTRVCLCQLPNNVSEGIR